MTDDYNPKVKERPTGHSAAGWTSFDLKRKFEDTGLGNTMDENVMVVFHGFLNLSMKEKMQMVGAMNDYFDSVHREPIRAENEDWFKEFDFAASGTICKCCGR